MAKINKYNFPFSGITGKVGNVDASSGRDPGINVTITERAGITHLSASKAISHPRTPARAARAKRYCDCDFWWKCLGEAKANNLVKWLLWTDIVSRVTLPAYQLFQRYCLKGYEEARLYRMYCWAGRYYLHNFTDYATPEQEVTLHNIPHRYVTGTDIEVWILTTKHTVLIQVPCTFVSEGIVQITAPAISPHAYTRFVVYSYKNLSFMDVD